MNDKKLIAGILLEIAKNSTTELIEDAKIDQEIIDSAKKMGMVIPSPDFAIFKTKWADIDKANLNNVRLPKKAVEKGIQSLVGKNLNFEHLGAYNVCGFCLSVKIKDEEIECIQVFYKSLYPDKFEELKEKIKTKEAAVSFEIWSVDPDTKKSVVKELEDGTREIDPIICHGTGLLLINPPACPTAKIFKLVATKKDNTNVEDKKYNVDLIFAQLAIEEPKCKNCVNCHQKKEGIKVDLKELYSKVTKEEDINYDIAMAFYYATDEEKANITEDAAKWTKKFINSLPDSAFAVIEPDYPEKTQDKNARHLPHHNGEGDLGKEKSNDNLDLPHYKNALARVNQTKPLTESITAEELQKKASAHLERHKDALEKAKETEEKLCQKCKKPLKENEEGLCADCLKKEEKASTEVPKPEEPKAETKPENSGAETKAEEPKVEGTEEKAQPLEQIEPKVVVKVTYIYSEVTIDTYVDGTPSGTNEVKAYTKKITEYKDGTKDEIEEQVEIKKKYDFAELEAAVNKVKAEKDVEIENLRTNSAKELESKDKEIEKLKQELSKKSQETIEADAPKNEEAKVMEVGNADTEIVENKEDKDRAKDINDIISNATKKK